jgi:branched-chain amino acid transport system ATP-binding protein
VPVALLRVETLSKAFGGVRAVDGVSFDLAAGERLALIGPNGAGKSTCFNMLNGQLRPDAGRVLLAGDDVTRLRPAEKFRAGVGRTFQITATFASMTACENVQVALLSFSRGLWHPFRLASAAQRDDALALLDRVGLANEADRAAGVLAYGDLKRLELAIALASRPRLLLMDEPTAGMAPSERENMMALVSSIVAAEGISVLFTEHDMDVVFGHADRVLVLNFGTLIFAGPPDAARKHARVREVYLGTGSTSGGH